MSEINKVYKQYGEIAGKQFLVLYYSSTLVASRFVKASDDKGLAAFNTRLDDHIRKEYGQDFVASYREFARENASNPKLFNELDKNKAEFLNKKITDLEKESIATAKREESKSVQGKQSDSVSKPTQTSGFAKQQQVAANRSKQGSVSIKGIKTDFSYDDPDKAIPVVKSATFLQPYDADNWCVLGDLYAAKKNWKSALAYYEKALTKNNKSSRATAGKERAKGILNGSIPDEENRSESVSPGQNPSITKEPVVEDEIYCFDNQQEFLLYVGLNKDKAKGKIIWGKGTQYQDDCKRGYSLFEQKQYMQAIDVYQRALKVNPVGVAARFEICTAYCQLKNFSAARDALKSIEPYTYSDKLIAKYYRTLGYILVEEQDYRTAANAYQYSLFFEPDQQSAKQELLYIVNKAGFDILEGIKDKKKVEKTLESAGVPLLTVVM